MQPSDCPNWEYSSNPKRPILPGRIAEILAALVSGEIDTQAVASDTREQHKAAFHELVPAGYEYYAGHYRGELYRCLRSYEVAVEGDPRVGALASSVKFYMAQLSAIIRSGILALDANLALTPKERLYYIVVFACRVFVQFLTVHPYANGNGHMGRLIVWSILGRYGHWPRRWSVEPRPPDPPYSELIVRYRNGQTEMLEKYVLEMLVS